MKKLLALGLGFLLSFSMAACGTNSASTETPATTETSALNLEGRKFVFKEVVEEDEKDKTNNGTVEFKNDNTIEISKTSVYVEGTFLAIAKGTYNQDGSVFTYSLTGVESMGEWHEYPDEIKEIFSNLHGSIDGETITMEFAYGNPEWVGYYHVLYTLEK